MTIPTPATAPAAAPTTTSRRRPCAVPDAGEIATSPRPATAPARARPTLRVGRAPVAADPSNTDLRQPRHLQRDGLVLGEQRAEDDACAVRTRASATSPRTATAPGSCPAIADAGTCGDPAARPATTPTPATDGLLAELRAGATHARRRAATLTCDPATSATAGRVHVRPCRRADGLREPSDTVRQRGYVRDSGAAR